MCCIAEVDPSIFTTNLSINLLYTSFVHIFSYTIPPSHTLLSSLPTDHEICHQWSGNPLSWDSINQHQRKPQRLLVKLLTNIRNIKRKAYRLKTRHSFHLVQVQR